MPITINGSGTVTGISAGGLPDGSVTPADLSQPLTLATAQASTSGTFIDFTGIPSWVKRITVMFDGVSTNGTSIPTVRVGTSAGVASTGYATSGFVVDSGSLVASFSGGQITTGLPIAASWVATGLAYGHCVFNNLSGNTWTYSLNLHIPGGNTTTAAGRVALSGTLDRVRITTTNGTDTFDAGSINIMYE